jgi:drug/metabolite transporter (DMT)-like permease
MFEGLKTAPAVSASAVFTLTPLMSAGVGFLLLRQVTTARMALALVLGGIGALWVIFRGSLDAALALEVGRGEAIYFFGCIAHALYTPLLARLRRDEPPFAYVFGILTGCALVLTALGAREIAATDWRSLPPVVWITLVYVALFASAATVTLISFAAARLPAAKVMAYTYLVPSWVILWELALGHGAPGWTPLAGVALTALALALLLRDEHRGTVRRDTGLEESWNTGDRP